MIFNAHRQKFLRVINVAAVDDERIAHRAGDDVPRRHAELLPFREHQHRVGINQRVIHVGGILHDVTKAALTLIHGNLFKHPDAGTGLYEHVHDHERGCLAHVVGLGFESKAPEGDGFA